VVLGWWTAQALSAEARARPVPSPGLSVAPSGRLTILVLVNERLVDVRATTVLRTVLLIIAVAVVLEVLWISRHVLSWILISIFLALALDPLVSWIERRGVARRSAAVGLTYVLVTLAIVGIGATFVPKLVDEVNGFVEATPGYVEDLTQGKGRLGFLERKYQIVEKVREQVQEGGASRLLGLSGTALAITKSVLTLIVATVTIIFLTFFLLLEGRGWVERFYSVLPEHAQARWRRIGGEISQTVGGYVTGNLLISLIAGTSMTIVLLIMGVPYAVALGLLVAVLDLIPLAGATIAGIIVVTISFLHSLPAGIVVAVFVIVYQQAENHVLQPVIYGRTVRLSPLVVLVSILIGAELAGILGALVAIPTAGAIQVLLRDFLTTRRERAGEGVALPP
jgi:predicted PurR-regulated permease PerM